MNIETLKELIQEGESDHTEFKDNFGNEAIKTAGAFANTRGGIIFIGINKAGVIKGTQATQETCKDWANRISQSTEPSLIPVIEPINTKSGTVVLIRINEFPFKPVAVRSRCFRRVNASNRQMSPAEIAQLHLQSTGSSYDACPSRNATLEDLDIKEVKKYIRKAIATGRRNYDESQYSIQILEKIDLIKDGKPTIAAILLFGKEPHFKISQATVHCGRFKEKTVIIDDRLIEGSIVKQVDEVMAFMRKNTNVRFVITGKAERDEIWDYPLDALREAVTNAICHRDYIDTSDIQIKIHDDYLTIWNPGGLLPGMSLDDLFDPNHSSKPRNKLVAQIFYDIRHIEKYGSGIQRILDECEKAGVPEPTFEEKFGGFLVTFKKDIYNLDNLRAIGLNERQIKAMALLKRTHNISNKDYCQLNSISRQTSTRELNQLFQKGLVIKEGTVGKGTKYRLK